MSLSSRYLWIDDNDRAHRFPTSRFHRVFAGKESVPEFSGKQVRFAEAVVETENRKTISISRLIYPLVSFDSNGFVDRETKEQEIRGIFEVMNSTFLENPREENLLRSGGKFEKKKFESRFRWSPDRELEQLIVEQLLSS